MRSFLLFLVLIWMSSARAQSIYGVWENQGNNTYYFVSLDPATAVKTNISTLPNMVGIISPNNTVIHADSGWYIVRMATSSSTRLLTIDIASGSILNDVSFPGIFVGFEWNENNDSIYCLYHDNSTSYNLATIDPISGSYNLYQTIPGINAYFGETFVLDQNSGLFSFRAWTISGNRLLTIDITDGSVAYDSPLEVNARGLEYNCNNDSIYCILEDSITSEYKLMVIDNTTGLLSLVDTLNDINGYASYTATLDVWNGTYSFYGFEGSASKLIDVDLATGSILNSPMINHNMAGWEGYETCNPPPPPQVEFEVSDTMIAEGDSVDFTDLSLFSPNSWTWSFSGGIPSSSSLQHPTGIRYDNSGCFEVTLSASNGQGSDTLTKTCYVHVVAAPEADFEADTLHVAVGDDVNFTDLSANDPTDWSWFFDAGFPLTSTDTNPTNITWSIPGNYDVRLAVDNIAGVDTIIKQEYIHVYDMPNADFVADDTVIMVGDTVNFTDLSSGNILSWSWDFSAGNPSVFGAQQPPGIIYSTAGCFDVRLIVSNPLGSDTLVKSCYIEVLPFPVQSDFVGDSLIIPQGSSVDFTDLSSNTPTFWQWTFQGGVPLTDTAQHPQNIQYDTPGCYDVSLYASNVSGGDTMTKVCYIEVIPGVGVESSEAHRIHVFPIPASDELNIHTSSSSESNAEITDLNGRVIKAFEFSNSIRVDVSDIAAGSYVLEVGEWRRFLLIE